MQYGVKVHSIVCFVNTPQPLCSVGSGSLSPYRPVQGGEGIPADHQKLLRAGDVGQGQPQTGPGQGCAAEHEW